MLEYVTDREYLHRELESLSDDQIHEVLEYISIMKSLREEEANSNRFKDEVTPLASKPDSPSQQFLNGKHGRVVYFSPRSKRAASR